MTIIVPAVKSELKYKAVNSIFTWISNCHSKHIDPNDAKNCFYCVLYIFLLFIAIHTLEISRNIFSISPKTS